MFLPRIVAYFPLKKGGGEERGVIQQICKGRECPDEMPFRITCLLQFCATGTVGVCFAD